MKDFKYLVKDYTSLAHAVRVVHIKMHSWGRIGSAYVKKKEADKRQGLKENGDLTELFLYWATNQYFSKQFANKMK